jgi:hypothetical protein
MSKFRPDYKNAFRILKGGKISLVVSALLLTSAVPSISNAAVNVGPSYANVVDDNDIDIQYFGGGTYSNDVDNITLGGDNDTFSGDDSYIAVSTNSSGSNYYSDLYVETNNNRFDLTIESSIDLMNYSDYNSDLSNRINGIEIYEDVVDGSTITNNGSIFVSSTTDANYAYGEDALKGISVGEDDFMNGSHSSNYGVITNNDEITVYSHAIGEDGAYSEAMGIHADYNNGTIINNKDIEVSADADTTWFGEDADAVAFGININDGYNDSNITNNGTIDVKADADTSSYGEDATATGTGIRVADDHHGTISNSGAILVDVSTQGEDGFFPWSSNADTHAYGISVYGDNEFRATISNSGDINITADSNGEDYVHTYAVGINVTDNNGGEILNSGNINIVAGSEGEDFSAGIFVSENQNDGSIASSGNINVSGEDEAYGIFVENEKISMCLLMARQKV